MEVSKLKAYDNMSSHNIGKVALHFETDIQFTVLVI